MKIAQIVCVYPPYAGGIGASAQKNHQIFQLKHHSVVFTKKNKQENLENEKNIIRLNAFLNWGHAGVLWQLLRQLKTFDVIYFHYPFFGTSFVIWLFKKLNPQKKLIIHYHMDVDHKNLGFKILAWPEKLIKKSLFKMASQVVVASIDYIQESQIKKYYQLWSEKFVEIPFFVDTDKFYPDLNKKNNKNNDEILFVGGLDKAHYFKGVDILIQAFAQANLKNTKLLIAGEGELKKEYQQLSAKLGIKGQVEFLGKLTPSKLINHYQRADVFVLPSINKNEAFGIVLIEALACATPVIASNLPGVRNVFADNISGLRIEPKNIESLKNKLTFILKNPETRNKMSQEARILAEKKYSKEVFALKIENLLK